MDELVNLVSKKAGISESQANTTTLLLVTDEQDRLGFVSDAKDKLHDSASE